MATPEQVNQTIDEAVAKAEKDFEASLLVIVSFVNALKAKGISIALSDVKHEWDTAVAAAAIDAANAAEATAKAQEAPPANA